MKELTIKSSLYDYTMCVIDDFVETIKGFSEKTVYVIDKNVYDLYKDGFASIPIEKIYLMNPIESKKNMDTVMDIIMYWKKLSMKKDWKVVCFGGGITQDVTTVASNLYLRNVDWYFFPTTLLSMSDSCVGGKCGINLGEYKNQIGVFYPPKKIFVDVRFLNTLSRADYINGWGEILKFSLTLNEDFYNNLKGEDEYIPCPNIAKFIREGLLVKKEIIEEDEFDLGLRHVLNYGHTFGHALEAYTNNEIPHGKGVIWGIDVVNYIAWKENLISKEYYLDIKKLIKEAFLPEEICVNNPEKLMDIVKTDKKVVDNVVNLAVLDKASHLIIYPMDIDNQLRPLFKDYLEENHEYYCN